MILLFSNQEYSPKVISIKKISEIKPKNIHIKTVNKRHAKLKQEIGDYEQTIKDLQQKKEELMTQLKEAIKKERDNWLETKERERQEVKKLAYKMGYDEGMETVQSEWEDKLKEANLIVTEAKKDYFHTLDKHEEVIVQLAIHAAEKVVKDSLIKNEACYLSVIKEAIGTLHDCSQLAIYVSEKNYASVMQQKNELEQLLEEGNILSIYVDQQLSEGSCVIKHPFGQTDVGVDVQLQQLKSLILEKMKEST